MEITIKTFVDTSKETVDILKKYNGMKWTETSSKDEASILAEVLNALDAKQDFPYSSEEVYGYFSHLIEDTLILENCRLKKVPRGYDNNIAEREYLTTYGVKDFLVWVRDNAEDHCAYSDPKQQKSLYFSNLKDVALSNYRLTFWKD